MLGNLSLTVLPLSILSRDSRRLRSVERDPRIATADDIELLVRAHGVPEQKVWQVTDRLVDGDLDPFLAWTWTMQHDGSELADLCGSRLTHREVVDLMTEHTGHIATLSVVRAA